MAYTTTAKQFFEDRVPGLLARDAIPAVVQGLVEFEIQGQDGGCWLVDFGAKSVRARGAGAPPKVAAIVRARDRDFMALVEGRMSPSDGILTERLHVAGDAASIGRLMEAFAKLRELAA